MNAVCLGYSGLLLSLQLIYIARNPRDTAISYFYFMQLLTQCSFQGTLSSFIDMFLSDKGMYIGRPFLNGDWLTPVPDCLCKTVSEKGSDHLYVLPYTCTVISYGKSWKDHVTSSYCFVLHTDTFLYSLLHFSIFYVAVSHTDNFVFPVQCQPKFFLLFLVYCLQLLYVLILYFTSRDIFFTYTYMYFSYCSDVQSIFWARAWVLAVPTQPKHPLCDLRGTSSRPT